MNNDAFSRYVEEVLDACSTLLAVKGREYAGSEDRLANFRRGATLTGCAPEQVAFIYLSKHYDAIATFVREGQVVGGEPIQGRLNDLINYCFLLGALLRERGVETISQERPYLNNFIPVEKE